MCSMGRSSATAPRSLAAVASGRVLPASVTSAFSSIAALMSGGVCEPAPKAARTHVRIISAQMASRLARLKCSFLKLPPNTARSSYRVATTDDDATCVMPAFAAAITVPSIITPQRIAAKMKPAVFIFIPLTRNTHRGIVGYAKKSPYLLGDYAAGSRISALPSGSFASALPPLPLGVPWRTSVARPSFSSARMSTYPASG